MACPKCNCNVTYGYNDDDMGIDDYDMERCAACGTIFYLMDATEDGPDDYTDLDYERDCMINGGLG